MGPPLSGHIISELVLGKLKANQKFEAGPLDGGPHLGIGHGIERGIGIPALALPGQFLDNFGRQRRSRRIDIAGGLCRRAGALRAIREVYRDLADALRHHRCPALHDGREIGQGQRARATGAGATGLHFEIGNRIYFLSRRIARRPNLRDRGYHVDRICRLAAACVEQGYVPGPFGHRHRGATRPGGREPDARTQVQFAVACASCEYQRSQRQSETGRIHGQFPFNQHEACKPCRVFIGASQTVQQGKVLGQRRDTI